MVRKGRENELNGKTNKRTAFVGREYLLCLNKIGSAPIVKKTGHTIDFYLNLYPEKRNFRNRDRQMNMLGKKMMATIRHLDSTTNTTK